jgi:hypothetical protein
MRRKVSYLIAVVAAIGLLQFAIPSADSAVSEVQEESVQSCPANKGCPSAKEAEAKDCTKVCPEDKANCPEGKASCPTSDTST